MEFKIDSLAKGTRIIMGVEAAERRQVLNTLIEIAQNSGFKEIILPAMEKAEYILIRQEKRF